MGKASRAAACVILRRLCQSAFSRTPPSRSCCPQKVNFCRGGLLNIVSHRSQHRVGASIVLGIVSIDRACADRPRVRALAAIWRVARCARVH